MVAQYSKTCPMCAETIRLEAVVCRFCGHKFSEEDSVAAKREIEARIADQHEQARQKEEQILQKQQERVRRSSLRKAGGYEFFGAISAVTAGLFMIGTLGMLFSDDSGTRSAAIVLFLLMVAFPGLAARHFLKKARGLRRDTPTTPPTLQ